MSTETLTAEPVAPQREKLTKKAITADHPTWCPGCGDFAVLACYYKVLEKRQIEHEKIVTLAGIGCSSRFPYFVNGHGAHFIHGRAVPLATGISLARPDLRVFWFPAWLLRALSGPLKLVQRYALGSKEPLDVAAAFASERYQTELAGQVIAKATRRP